jgi:pyruvate dehydrogenase E2 component (dihydrolipoamide acetyltransferase)
MAVVIKMPKMSDTMTEGVIASWLVKVGDKVKSGDILAEVETDKATMELENYEDGVILYIGVKEKESIAVNGIIAVIGQAGEDFQSLIGGGATTVVSAAKSETPVATAQSTSTPSPTPTAVDTSKIPAQVIRMPKMSDTMTEGVIASWLVKVGDYVKPGDILAEVETDKATMELENYEEGTVLYIDANKSIPVNGIIAIIGKAGTDYTPLLSNNAKPTNSSATSAPQNTTTTSSSNNSSEQKTVSVSGDGGRVFASPLAKKIAKEKGLDLAQITGSGENGRIIRKDVETFVPKSEPKTTAKPEKTEKAPAVAAPLIGKESFEEVPVSQMRKTIARRLADSLFTSPHFYLTMEINMDKAIEARKSMNEVALVKISFNDMVIKAVAASLRQHPKVNSSWLGDKIRYNHHVHIGVAVAVEEGLLVPVVRFADQKSLSQIAGEVKTLGAKAKDKKLQPSDWEGNTFTISNLGMFGIEEFTAIINPPDACILAVGAIKETAIVKNGQLVIGNVMKVTLSCDHRVVDGAIGSAFLQTLKSLLEDPIRLLV